MFEPDPYAPAPNTGQVWLAGHPQRVLIWIRSATVHALTVHPVTIDVAFADDTALIVASCPTINEPAAIFTSVVATVPPGALVAYLGDLLVDENINSLAKSNLTGAVTDLPTGQPIISFADERLEFRQLLADEVVALDPVDDDEDVAVPPPPTRWRAATRHPHR